MIAEKTADGSTLKQGGERFPLTPNGFNPLAILTASGDEKNPLLMAPAITYDLVIAVGSQGADKPLFMNVGGTIDGFPAYEVTIVRPETGNNSEQLVWSFDPTTKGNTPTCLIDYYCDENVDSSITGTWIPGKK